MIGHKITVQAADVQPGDFTIFSGFRRVVTVRKASRGASSAPWKRTDEHLPRIAFVRTGGEGDAERVDRVHAQQSITVYRGAI